MRMKLQVSPPWIRTWRSRLIQSYTWQQCIEIDSKGWQLGLFENVGHFTSGLSAWDVDTGLSLQSGIIIKVPQAIRVGLNPTPNRWRGGRGGEEERIWTWRCGWNCRWIRIWRPRIETVVRMTTMHIQKNWWPSAKAQACAALMKLNHWPLRPENTTLQNLTIGLSKTPAWACSLVS